MWFDEIMDDSKHALHIAKNNKGIFVPVFVKLGLSILFYIFCFATIVSSIVHFFATPLDEFHNNDVLFQKLPFIIIMLLINYLLFVIGNSILEVGSINLYKSAAYGTKPKASIFFEGVKKYFLKVFGGKLFIHLIVILFSPIILILLLIYSTTIGILTAGWGLILLSVIVMVFFKAWTAIVVIDNYSPIRAISTSFKLGKKYFWGLFIINLSFLLISRYFINIFGPLIAIIAGWFITGIISTLFKLIILLIYNRKKEELIYK